MPEYIELEPHRGVRIQLNRWKNFEALFPDEELEEGEFRRESFKTYEECTAAIDAQAKSEAKAVKLSLPVLVADDNGLTHGLTPNTITGVNMGTQNLTYGKRPTTKDRYRSSVSVYPRVPWIESHLKRRKELNEELERLNADLRAVSISTSMGYGRVTPEKYPALLDRLIQKHQAAVNMAEELAEKMQS